MKSKTDWTLLLLITAVMFGAVLRFWPSLMNGFPVLDGGLFYVMARDLQANHFIPPRFTTYNHVNIPYTYPPLGFYVTNLLSIFAPASDNLWIFLYVPALISTICIWVFYKLAKEMFPDSVASLATLVFALSSRAFFWDAMGGGMTRAFGKLFLLLMVQQALHLFRDIYLNGTAIATGKADLELSKQSEIFKIPLKPILWIILFGTGVILSHPAAILHAVLAGVLIFLYYGRSIRGIISAAWISGGILLLSSPWLVGTILLQHGLQPFIYAAQTSQHTIENLLTVLKFYSPFNYIAIPVTILMYVGAWRSFKQHEYFIVLWVILINVIDPRGAEYVAPIPEAMLAGLGLWWLLAKISPTSDTANGNFAMRPLIQAIVFTWSIYLVITSSFTDFRLVNSSLKPADLEMIAWVNANIEKDKNFLIATGHEFSMSDPVQEWFPALTDQHSITTLQGMEWMLGKNFFPWLEQLTLIQHCADVDCLDTWTAQNHVKYDYLIITIPDTADKSVWATSLRSLANSTRSSNKLLLVGETSNSLILKNICCQ